jgi:DNA-binding YbaB/EbfC family protein
MNINQLMQQAQKAQRDIEKKMSEFESKQFEFNYKNDAVIVRINGACKITDLKINNALIDPEDPQMLTEMISEAINSAVSAIIKDREEIKTSIGKR